MCLKGYNCTILAYGQSGTGKTYTIQGNEDQNNNLDNPHRGLIPRCLEFLFNEISKLESSTLKYTVKANFIQIYNEQIYDLGNFNQPQSQSQTPTALKLVEDRGGNMVVELVTDCIVDSPEKALEFFYKSTKNRIVSATKLNADSSRSHCVFTLTITSHVLTPTGLAETSSKFNLVDLAGSESQKKAPTSGLLREQAISINKSLSTLGTVINTLVNTPKGRTAYIRYRDSKLTHLLKDSLGGNSLTSIIGNISPCSSTVSETISTLRFVKRAKLVQNSAKINRDFKVSVPQLQTEIEKLKAEIT
ncbi:P-loop containing nucleoside triphosphate hydrolase protein, partial [Conidiobolus coronatus NRRL 28638]